jgi:prolyl-tRNA synthetase
MRWTQTLVPTLKEDPSDAEIISHKLMVRAGLIRKLASGTYNYLPLGLRSLNKAIKIVREEMDRAGAVEILMPILQPIELWQESDRFGAFGELMCKFKGRLNCLGPTHEEVVTHIVRSEINSYRQLPITLYQIQTKFRDEIRPRFGVMRSREFLMKDAYSFDTGEAGLAKSYQAMYDAYCRIFTRAGLKYVIVEADTGLMGGDVSHEFMVPTSAGEDVLFSCAKCGYSANREKAGYAPPKAPETRPAEKRMEEVPTPGATSVADVAKLLGVKPSDLVKTMIYLADGKPAAFLIRGDHELNPTKAARAAKAESLVMADPQTIEKVTGGQMGFSGPVGLKIPVYADHTVTTLSNFIVGANRLDTHIVNANFPRDFSVTGVTELRMATEDDLCPRCGGAMGFTHGVEIGHVFKLGTKYSKKLGANFQAEDGQIKPAVMGCYGIGVNRILASAIEASHDDKGIIWPINIAPYEVLLVSIKPDNPDVARVSKDLYDELTMHGFDVLWDDRDISAGIKFNDADLVGIPIRITAGKNSIANGNVDVKTRSEKQQTAVPLNGVLAAVKQMAVNLRQM